jgi:hypothetical protein
MKSLVKYAEEFDSPFAGLFHPCRDVVTTDWQVTSLGHRKGVGTLRFRSRRCAFSKLPAVIFSSIFALTLSLSAVIASVNQIHSKEAFMESYVTELIIRKPLVRITTGTIGAIGSAQGRERNT